MGVGAMCVGHAQVHAQHECPHERGEHDRVDSVAPVRPPAHRAYTDELRELLEERAEHPHAEHCLKRGVLDRCRGVAQSHLRWNRMAGHCTSALHGHMARHGTVNTACSQPGRRYPTYLDEEQVATRSRDERRHVLDRWDAVEV